MFCRIILLKLIFTYQGSWFTWVCPHLLVNFNPGIMVPKSIKYLLSLHLLQSIYKASQDLPAPFTLLLKSICALNLSVYTHTHRLNWIIKVLCAILYLFSKLMIHFTFHCVEISPMSFVWLQVFQPYCIIES